MFRFYVHIHMRRLCFCCFLLYSLTLDNDKSHVNTFRVTRWNNIVFKKKKRTGYLPGTKYRFRKIRRQIFRHQHCLDSLYVKMFTSSDDVSI